MNNVLISHECPLQLLEQSVFWNDYDYILVHLLDKYPKYLEFAQNSIKTGRMVLLDNSIFELGTAFDADKYAEWIKKLNPTQYFVPDCLQDAKQTISNFDNWLKKYTKLPGIKIGVVQGRSYEELVHCYNYMCYNANKVAISFDYDYYLINGLGNNKWQKYANGRKRFIDTLVKDKIWNIKVPHHLLGTALPQSMKDYDFKKLNIETVDTSNPIQQSLLGLKYTTNGLEDKNTLKVADSFEATYTAEQINTASYNVKKFREFCLWNENDG